MKFAEFHCDDFEYHEKLGSGSYGTVYRAVWIKEKKEVAVKKILTLGDEAEVLSLLSHKHIIQFYGAVVTAPNYCLVTEYARNGSLYDYISKNELDFQQILSWSKQIALGISYLHNEAPFKILHRDLKSKNVVITEDMVVKLCDFGSSRYFDQTTKMSIAGTYPWMAPEVIQSMPVSEACDTFSYGIVLWEMLTREVPFKGFEGVQVQYLVVVKEERLAIPSSCPKEFSSLLQSCWLTDPKQRPNFHRILELLSRMSNNYVLADVTNSFLKNKNEWKSEMENMFARLKAMELNLSTKEKELQERELRLLNKERSVNIAKMLNKTDLNDWEESDVFLWVEQLGNEAVDLKQYAQMFFNNHINGKRLRMLTTNDLFEMGITSFGHRKELEKKLSELVEELEHLTHFPPLHPSPTIEAETFDQRKIPLTLLFGNHCRMGPTQTDHKWKVYVEVDGEEEALSSIKDVQLKFNGEVLVLSQEPYVMNKWYKAGDRNTPIFVECVVTYENRIKKPRTTKHNHEVIIKEGGSVFQQTVELLARESSTITSISDDGYATASSSATMNSCRLSSRLSSSSLNTTSSINEEMNGISWADKLKGQSPITFMPRTISDANREVLLRNRELAAGSPRGFIRKISYGKSSPACTPRMNGTTDCKSSRDNMATMGTANTVIRRNSSSPASPQDSPWTIVKRNENKDLKNKPVQRRNDLNPNNLNRDKYFRSKSDQTPVRSVNESRNTRLVHTDGQRYDGGRGRGQARGGRGRGFPGRGKQYPK